MGTLSDMSPLQEIHIQSLLRDDPVITPLLDENRRNFPQIKVIKSCNGYDKEETIREFKSLGINFKKVQPGFETYGAVACTTTKIKDLLYQIENKVPYMVMIEDDMWLGPDFVSFVEKQLPLFKEHSELNLIRLHRWSEGIITSTEGARRIVDRIRRIGMITQIDNQFEWYSGPIRKAIPGSKVFKRMRKPNEGDSLGTPPLDDYFYSRCRNK